MDFGKTARIFKALSVDTRLQMVELLKRRSLCVNALARALDVSAPAVSQHLRVLRDADIVCATKRGYFVHYSINEAALTSWRKVADRLLTANGGQKAAPSKTQGPAKAKRRNP